MTSNRDPSTHVWVSDEESVMFQNGFIRMVIVYIRDYIVNVRCLAVDTVSACKLGPCLCRCISCHSSRYLLQSSWLSAIWCAAGKCLRRSFWALNCTFVALSCRLFPFCLTWFLCGWWKRLVVFESVVEIRGLDIRLFIPITASMQQK